MRRRFVRVERAPVPCRKIILYLFIIVILYSIFRPTHKRHHEDTDCPFQHDQGIPALSPCVHPELDVHNRDLEKYFTHVELLTCDVEPDWVHVVGSTAKISMIALEKYGDIECNVTDIIRQDDWTNIANQAVTLNTHYSLSRSDFVKVKCFAKSVRKSWENVMAGMRYNFSIHARSGWKKIPKDGLRLNVLVFGFASVSRMHFIRKLPKSYKYMTKELNAVVLEGYNILGDGTPQALIPILTGKTEPELPEVRARMTREASHVNVYPFIWNEFQRHGYVTAYAEDCPEFGTFTYRLKGFNEMPTDHYMRPFFLEVNREMANHRKFCLGSVPRHKILMNYVENFFHYYYHKPKFMFAFHGELSNSDLNLIEAADGDLLAMLQSLHEANLLNNTLLIIMSDHGARSLKMRQTQQGKQEERMPMFSLIFPPWFSKAYPEAFSNVQDNAQRLTTPLDIHETLRNVLRPTYEEPASSRKRSFSLFQRIPPERSCFHAGIAPHWCSCLNWQQLSPTDHHVRKASKAAVDFLNKYTSSNRDKCALLSLFKVVWASKLLPIMSVMHYKQSADADGFAPDLSDNTRVTEETYQIYFYTQPGDRHFEVSIKHYVQDDTYDMKPSQVSSMQKRESVGNCITDHYADLQRFCHCKYTVGN